MLTDSGVQLDDIEVPELHLILLAHRVIIICEMSTGINYDFEVNYEEIVRIKLSVTLKSKHFRIGFEMLRKYFAFTKDQAIFLGELVKTVTRIAAFVQTCRNLYFYYIGKLLKKVVNFKIKSV